MVVESVDQQINRFDDHMAASVLHLDGPMVCRCPLGWLAARCGGPRLISGVRSCRHSGSVRPASRRLLRLCWASGMALDTSPQKSDE